MARMLDLPAEQVAALCDMTPARKLAVAAALYRQARHLKAAGLRAQHPDWPEARIARAVRSIFLHGDVDA